MSPMSGSAACRRRARWSRRTWHPRRLELPDCKDIQFHPDLTDYDGKIGRPAMVGHRAAAGYRRAYWWHSPDISLG